MPAKRPPLAALALWIAATPVASGQDLPTPQPREGDTWVYRITLTQRARPARTYSAETTAVRRPGVAGLLLAGRVAGALPRSISTLDGAIAADACMTDVAGRVTLQAPPCHAPGQVGDAWTVPVNAEQIRDVKLLGRESVAVPAGDFETLKLEVREHARPGLPAELKSRVMETEAIVWYAPAIGAVVRAERQTRLADGTIAVSTVQAFESFSRKDAAAVSTNRLPAPDNLGSHAAVMASNCQPPYPTASMRAGVTGLSRVRVAVDAGGRATDAELVGASGPTAEHRSLDDAALEAARHCAFIAATDEDRKPIAAMLDVGFSWQLR